MGVPESGLGILLSILRKGLRVNKSMPVKMNAVLWMGGTKTQSETHSSVGIGSSRVSHNK